MNKGPQKDTWSRRNRLKREIQKEELRVKEERN